MTIEPSKGFIEAELSLLGKTWTADEANHLRALIDAGEAGERPYKRLHFPMRDALKKIVADLCSLHRYRNMKTFPVVMMMAKRAANDAADALGEFQPFEDIHDI